MKSFSSEVLDLALTQALERYLEMEPNEAYETIAAEWPEQIAVLLSEFIFRTTCGVCGVISTPIHLVRNNGSSSFISLFCDCEDRPFGDAP